MPPGSDRRRVRHHPFLQRLGRRVGRRSRRWTGWLLDQLVPEPMARPLPAGSEVRRVLVVRPNDRLGNALLATPIVVGVAAIWPGAQIDVLATDSTADVFRRLPGVGRVYSVSRRFILRPWGVLRLIREVRRQRYDVAVEAGMGSFSGGLWCALSGARHRTGQEGRNRRFLDAPLGSIRVQHVSDWAPELVRRLGGSASERPIFALRPEDEQSAREVLGELGWLAPGGQVLPFVVAFVGGHLDKRWPIPAWREALTALAAEGLPVLIALGPEERHLAGELATPPAPGHLAVLPPGSIGRLAALFALARVVVTTDSGPLHLAVGAGARIVAIIRSPSSEPYLPRGPGDAVLRNPTPAAVEAELRRQLSAPVPIATAPA